MNNKTFNRTLVTAALPYANSGVYRSLGWCLRSFRHLRALSPFAQAKVLFVCGSDEHGVVTIRARKEGCTVQEVVAEPLSPTHQTVV